MKFAALAEDLGAAGGVHALPGSRKYQVGRNWSAGAAKWLGLLLSWGHYYIFAKFCQ
jgi:hypothetical protein